MDQSSIDHMDEISNEMDPKKWMKYPTKRAIIFHAKWGRIYGEIKKNRNIQ